MLFRNDRRDRFLATASSILRLWPTGIAGLVADNPKLIDAWKLNRSESPEASGMHAAGVMLETFLRDRLDAPTRATIAAQLPTVRTQAVLDFAKIANGQTVGTPADESDDGQIFGTMFVAYALLSANAYTTSHNVPLSVFEEFRDGIYGALQL